MANNPVDDFLEEKEKQAFQKRAEDVKLWEQWKQDPNAQTLEPLLNRFEPMFGQRVRMWKAPNVSESAFRANLKTQAIKAFETYDPNKAALSTHVGNRLKKSLRFTRKHQNLAYIPEAKAERIGPIQAAQDELEEQFGRPPTPLEISEHMNASLPAVKHITPAHIAEIQKQQVRDVFGSAFESDPTPKASVREQEVLPLLRPALKQDEQVVFDYLYGHSGKPRITSTGQIAKKLGKSPSQISRVKKRIEEEYKKFV